MTQALAEKVHDRATGLVTTIPMKKFLDRFFQAFIRGDVSEECGLANAGHNWQDFRDKINQNLSANLTCLIAKIENVRSYPDGEYTRYVKHATITLLYNGYWVGELILEGRVSHEDSLLGYWHIQEFEFVKNFYMCWQDSPERAVIQPGKKHWTSGRIYLDNPKFAGN